MSHPLNSQINSADCPLVSVIIPAYNRAHCLPRTLESVLAQRYPHWELIVVDDGSTDNTHEVMQPYLKELHAKTPGSIIYVRQENQGVSVARNHGLSLARGRYVCFLDSDDVYAPSFLESTVAMAQQHRVPIVFTAFNLLKLRTNTLKRYQHTHHQGVGRRFTLGEFDFYRWQRFTILPSILFERRLFTEGSVEFTPRLPHGEDTEVIIKLLHTHPSYYHSEPLFTYLLQQDSVTAKLATPYPDRLRMYLRATAWVRTVLEGQLAPRQLKRQLQSLERCALVETLTAVKRLPQQTLSQQQTYHEFMATYVQPISFWRLWSDAELSLWKKLKLSVLKFTATAKLDSVVIR